jgi:hypothetical protein
MKIYKFENGEFSQIDDHVKAVDGEDFDATLRKAGYVTFGSYGHPADLGIHIMEGNRDMNKDMFRYRVSVGMPDFFEEVVVDDFPQLLKLLRELLPLVMLSFMHSDLAEVLSDWVYDRHRKLREERNI